MREVGGEAEEISRRQLQLSQDLGVARLSMGEPLGRNAEGVYRDLIARNAEFRIDLAALSE